MLMGPFGPGDFIPGWLAAVFGVILVLAGVVGFPIWAWITHGALWGWLSIAGDFFFLVAPWVFFRWCDKRFEKMKRDERI